MEVLLVVSPNNTDVVTNSPSIEKTASSAATNDDGSVVLENIDEVTEASTSYEEMSSSDWENQTISSSSEGEEEEGYTPAPQEESLSYPEIGPISPGTSILKNKCTDASCIKNSRRSWHCLPKPDLELIIRKSSADPQVRAQSDSSKNDDQRRNSVVFGSVIIRSYDQTLGDNPCVGYGPPISLDWDYEEHAPLTLDDYEDNRKPRRSPRQMLLSYYTRKNLLMWKYGIEETDIRLAHKQAKKERMKRNVTRTFIPIMKLEDALESARRKAKRVFGNKTPAP